MVEHEWIIFKEQTLHVQIDRYVQTSLNAILVLYIL